jgi:hypothetical protein
LILGYAWLRLYGLASAVRLGYWLWLVAVGLALAWLWLGFGLALAWLLATVQLAVVWKLEMVAVSNFYEEGDGPFSVRTEFC